MQATVSPALEQYNSSTGMADARHLPQRLDGVKEGASAEGGHHRIKTAIGEVERLGVHDLEGRIEVEAVRSLASHIEHLWAQVDGGNGTVFRIVREIFAGTNGHLQHVPRRLLQEYLP